MKKQLFLFFLSLGIVLSGCQQKTTAPPKPYGPLPNKAQLNWQELEIISIVHFGLNTFTDIEWGSGGVDPSKFNPTDFDPNQIVSAAKAGGINGLILVAKHHDGFCLWPTEATEYNISQSPWKDGKGDMVKAFETATRNQDLQFGIYCSPWDRNNAHYGDSLYLEIYRKQLKELYTGYGDLFEVWFDGANGGDGYYGGANEVRKIDRTTYYHWDSTWKIVRNLQPGAVIFSDMGPGARWVGNENGFAADTTWETFTPIGIDGGKPGPGSMDYATSPTGTRNGKYWIPAECDFPLRPGWFWHADQDPKTPQELFDIYIHSVGRAGNMNIGLAPDTTGQLSQEDVKSLKAFGNILENTFDENLAEKATFTASNVRGDASQTYGTALLTDGDRYSYWATDDSVHTPTLEVDLKEPQTFDVIQLRENIKLGQRITSVAIDKWREGKWQQIATATGIGANRLIRLSQPITTEKVRLRVTDSPVCIALSDFGLYKYAEGE